MNSSTVNLIEKIKQLEIKPDQVETLERCETITNLIIPEVLSMFHDKELVENIKWLQEAHRGPNQHRWNNIVELTNTLLMEAGGVSRVKEYHSLEQSCKDVTEEELENIDDTLVRETIRKIKHIHEQTLIRMTHLIEKTYYI